MTTGRQGGKGSARAASWAGARFLAGTFCALAGLEAHAATREGPLDLPAGRPLTYVVELPVEHPGRLVVRAEWSGSRVVSFRLEGPPGSAADLRRAGPPPQRMELAVGPTDAGPGRVWKLWIRALPGRERAQGTLSVDSPDAQPPAPALDAAEPPAPPPPAPDPWQVARTPPLGLSRELGAFHGAVEAFRHRVVDLGTTEPDRYGWQDGLLRWLAEERDRLTAGENRPAADSRRLLERIADTIRKVDALRVSSDPILAGPAPTDDVRRRAWLGLRKQRMVPLERQLNDLLNDLRRGHAPELEELGWPARLLSCLAACELYFDERGRLGEEEASNADVAAAQWDTLLSAASALEGLAAAR